MASYIVDVVRALYSNLVEIRLMTISYLICEFLALFLIQITLDSWQGQGKMLEMCLYRVAPLLW